MKNILIIIVAIVAVFFATFTYTVDERETAIKLKFNEIVETDIKPGLHFKIPMMNNIKKFPTLILTLDAKPDDFLTNKKKSLVVDFFVKWRISNVSDFYRATQGNIGRAQNRLESIMKDGLRNEFSTRTIHEAITGERGEIMDAMRDKAAETALKLGIEIVDTRVSQIDFPPTASLSVYARMESERVRVAQEFRSKGKAAGEKIRAIADREATIIEANAYRDAEKLRGEGDAKSANIYAGAFQKDTEFYAFYRSLSAYRKSLGKNGDIMVVEPDADFFKYFKNQNGQ
ncbi:MAG: protease modulator HflC [Cocleimonas sp.]